MSALAAALDCQRHLFDRSAPARPGCAAAPRCGETIIRSQDDVALAQAGGLGEPGLTCAIFAASPRMRIVEAWARAG